MSQMVPNPCRWSLLEPQNRLGTWHLPASCQADTPPATPQHSLVSSPPLLFHYSPTLLPSKSEPPTAPPIRQGVPLDPPAWCPVSSQPPPQLRFFAVLMPRVISCCYHVLKTLNPVSLGPQLRSTHWKSISIGPCRRAEYQALVKTQTHFRA